jgi:hypothetical protein
MRKSAAVPLTVLGLTAAAIGVSIGTDGFTGCSNGPAHCVDAQNRLAPDESCRRGSGGIGYLGYHYIYGGSSGGHFGDTVVGASTTSRGGFGHGGGGEGGE